MSNAPAGQAWAETLKGERVWSAFGPCAHSYSEGQVHVFQHNLAEPAASSSYLLGMVTYVRRRRATAAPIARMAVPTKERLVGSGTWLPPTSLMITYVTGPAAPATKPG